jgi:hypothetical protein
LVSSYVETVGRIWYEDIDNIMLMIMNLFMIRRS